MCYFFFFFASDKELKVTVWPFELNFLVYVCDWTCFFSFGYNFNWQAGHQSETIHLIKVFCWITHDLHLCTLAVHPHIHYHSKVWTHLPTTPHHLLLWLLLEHSWHFLDELHDVVNWNGFPTVFKEFPMMLSTCWPFLPSWSNCPYTAWRCVWGHCPVER